jgi:hypothetical protein
MTRPWKAASEELEVAFAKLLQVKPLMVTPDYKPEWLEARRLLQTMMGACVLGDPDGARLAIAEYLAVLNKIMGEGDTA